MRVPLDIVGDIAILKFSRWTSIFYKKYYGWRLMRGNKSLKVVLEKTAGFSGVLRIQDTRWICGEKRSDTIHRENGCSFYLDVNKTYFSPRMSQDRKIIAEEILNTVKPKSKILVLFSGVSPFPIVLAKLLKRNRIVTEIFSSELNNDACRYGEKNISMNKVENYVKIFCGDSGRLCESLSKKKQRFDFVIMLRPNLKNSFLGSVLKIVKKGTVIYYHGFGDEKSIEEEILKDVLRAKRKISCLSFRKSGDIGIKKNRYSINFKILN